MKPYSYSFICIKTVPGRLRVGSTYYGTFRRVKRQSLSGTYWRIEVTDDTGILMTFDPNVFEFGIGGT